MATPLTWSLLRRHPLEVEAPAASNCDSYRKMNVHHPHGGVKHSEHIYTIVIDV
jgi:hypothetical protein